MKRLALPPQARKSALVLAIALGAFGIGCGSEPPPPPKAADAVAPKSTAPAGVAKKDTDKPTSGSLHIDDKIMKACGDLPTAHFAFDSDDVAGDAAAALDALARCFVSGPLKGKAMRLIGHADNRGEQAYNQGLGQKRAGSVAEFLAKKGLEQGRINTTSKGELEATGTDDEGWAKDRKVEVFLAE
jgi:peptidoglycan-associated lipoprotein